MKLVAQINEKGIVQKLVVYKSAYNEITELATAVIFYAIFEPVTCTGELCKMAFPLEFKLAKPVNNSKTLNTEDIPSKTT